jgi:hypothetical protein
MEVSDVGPSRSVRSPEPMALGEELEPSIWALSTNLHGFVGMDVP